MDVNGSRRSMIIHIRIEIEPGIQKHLKRWEAGLMNGQSFWSQERVVKETFNIDWSHGDSTHVGISKHIIAVIGCVDAANDRLKKREPPWVASEFL